MMIRDTNFQTPTKHGMNYIPCYRLPFLSLFHADCMEIMNQYPDKYFDLAIVDPPYGIGIVQEFEKTVKSKSSGKKCPFRSCVISQLAKSYIVLPRPLLI